MNQISYFIQWLALSLLAILSLSSNASSLQPVEAKHEENKPWEVEYLKLESGFLRAMPPGQTTTAIFLKATNQAKYAIEIVDVSAEVGNHAMIHKTIVENNLAKMVHVDSIVVEPREKLNLEPGGMHIMLMGVTSRLKIGDTIKVTLHYANGSQQTFDVEIALK